jgi:hypothetical protein
MRIEKDKLIFESGKIVQPYQGIVGINNRFDITEGYDGYIRDTQLESETELSKEELIELADYMIGLWKRFKDEVKK